MRIYILSMYEEHGAELIKFTVDKSKVPSMLARYGSMRSPMGGKIEYVSQDEFDRLNEALEEDVVGM